MNENKIFTDRDPKKELDINPPIPKKKKPWAKPIDPFSTTKQTSNKDTDNRENNK